MTREMVMKVGDGKEKAVRIKHALKMRRTALTALALMRVVVCFTEPQFLEELPMEYQRMMVATSYDPRVSIPASETFTWISTEGSSQWSRLGL
jgi:hypothetical protein